MKLKVQPIEAVSLAAARRPRIPNENGGTMAALLMPDASNLFVQFLFAPIILATLMTPPITQVASFDPGTFGH
jgi:hypothetical protein